MQEEMDPIVENNGICMYDNKEYGPGAQVCQNGKLMTCTNGQWVWYGEKC